MNKLTIGLAINPKTSSEELMEKEHASNETIQAITNSLEYARGRVVLLDANKNIYDEISRLKGELDIVFNIAEGVRHAEYRRSSVASMLDSLGIPHTGSGVEAHLLGNNKAIARAVLGKKVPQPNWQYFKSPNEPLEDEMDYPLFVKPATLGESLGISQDSIVYSEPELRKALKRVFEFTGQHAIVEELVEGKDYHTGIVGDLILPPIELDLNKIPGKPKVRDPSVKAINKDYFEPVISDDLIREIAIQGVTIHNTLGARDYGRSDLKGDNVKPKFIEANLMPGLIPGRSSITKEAELAGIGYSELIGNIVYAAIKRISQNPRYMEKFSTIETDGFRQAYENAIKASKYSEKIEFGGNNYKILKPNFLA